MKIVMLHYSRLMVMSWNNVTPPSRWASTFMNACGVTDVLSVTQPSTAQCEFMYLCKPMYERVLVDCLVISHAF